MVGSMVYRDGVRTILIRIHAYFKQLLSPRPHGGSSAAVLGTLFVFFFPDMLQLVLQALQCRVHILKFFLRKEQHMVCKYAMVDESGYLFLRVKDRIWLLH